MQDGDIQKSIDDIINLKKPRSFLSLLKMIYLVTKNFMFSMNAFIIGIVALTLYHYLIKRKLFCLVSYRILDKIAWKSDFELVLNEWVLMIKYLL